VTYLPELHEKRREGRVPGPPFR